MAASLPTGTSGAPSTASWKTARADAKWVTVIGGVATLHATSGSFFARELCRGLGLAQEARITVATLLALRAALGRQTNPVIDISKVSASQLDRDTLRAACWLVSRQWGRDTSVPDTQIWLPDGHLDLPRVGDLIPEGPTGILRTVLSVSGGGSSSHTSTSGSSGSSSHTSTGGSSGGSKSPIAEAGAVTVKGLVFLGVAGAVAVGVMKLHEHQPLAARVEDVRARIYSTRERIASHIAPGPRGVPYRAPASSRPVRDDADAPPRRGGASGGVLSLVASHLKG